MATEKEALATYNKAAKRFTTAEGNYRRLIDNLGRAETQKGAASAKIKQLKNELANDIKTQPNIFEQAAALMRKGIAGRIADAQSDVADAQLLVETLRGMVPDAKREIAAAYEQMKDARQIYVRAVARARIETFAQSHWKELAAIGGAFEADSPFMQASVNSTLTSVHNAIKNAAGVSWQTEATAATRFAPPVVAWSSLLSDADRTALANDEPLSQSVPTDTQPRRNPPTRGEINSGTEQSRAKVVAISARIEQFKKTGRPEYDHPGETLAQLEEKLVRAKQALALWEAEAVARSEHDAQAVAA